MAISPSKKCIGSYVYCFIESRYASLKPFFFEDHNLSFICSNYLLLKYTVARNNSDLHLAQNSLEILSSY